MTTTHGSRFFPFALLLALLAVPALAQAQDVVPIADAREQGVDAPVTVAGTVTRAHGDFVRLQDESGPTGASALVVRQTSGAFYDDVQDGTIAAGTQLQVTGTLSEYNGLLQINAGALDSYSVNGQTDVPAPQTVTLQDVKENGADYASELVRIEGLRVSGGGSGTFAADQSYDVTDGTTTLTLRVQGADETAIIGEPVPGGAFTYTGVTGIFFPDYFDDPAYQLIPVRPSDVEATASVTFTGRSYALTYEEDGPQSVDISVRAFALGESESVTVTVSATGAGTATANDVDGFDGTQTFTFSGSDPAPQTLTLTANADGEEEGIERLELELSSDTGGATTFGDFTLWVLDDATSQTTLFADLEGEALREQLRETFASGFGDQPGPPTLGYDVARDTLYGVVYNEDGLVHGIYTDFTKPLSADEDPSVALCSPNPSSCTNDNAINAEHAWPQSKGAGEEPATSNMHILLPARGDVNSARSNYPYGEIPDEDTDTWYFEDQTRTSIPSDNIDAWSEVDSSPSDRDARRFEPRESVKGDVARKAFYFVMAYPGRASLAFFDREKSALHQWHDEDPVDATEQRRNVLIASYQGDELNPFELDPTLVERAFFSGDPLGGDVLTIAEARALDLDRTATVAGVVTRIDDGDTIYLQDETAALAVFDTAVAPDVSQGDSVRLTGTTDAFAGALQLSDVTSHTVLSSGNALPAAQTLTLSEIAGNAEAYESELVRVEGLTFDMAGGVFSGGTNYTVSDESGGAGAVELRIPGSSFYVGEPIPGGAVTFTGVLGQYNGGGPGDIEPDEGYQLSALAAGDLSGGTTGETLTVDFSRSFGDPDASTGYRLAALPGNADRPLASTIDGTSGSAWQAYWDDGSDADFFVKWNDSDTFDFRPGRGFWLIAEDDWTVQTSLPAVMTADDGSYAIDLHDGWNIISNPLAEDVAWSAVQDANDGASQPLWSFNGSYMQAETFASATTNGQAFYFLNSSGLAELTIPAAGTSQPAVARAAAARGKAQTLVLSTYRAGRRTSTARLGTAPGAADGLDAHDAFAPPGRFEAASLRLPLPGAATQGKRRQWLAGERRAPGADGYAFDLVLQATGEAPVTLRAGGLSAFAGEPVHLVETATGRTHDLRAEPTVEIAPQTDETRLRLLVGSAAMTEGQQGLPDEVTLRPGYPNPFRADVTLKYALPEAADVHATVYDLLGRRVRTLADGHQTAGTHTLTWDGQSTGGSALASGVYFVRLTAGGVTRSQKIVRVQ